MKNDKFKPMLAPNASIDLGSIKYPQLMSNKLDGIRVIFGWGRMVSRSLKEIPNIQLQEKYKELMELSEKENVILDGEFYSHSSTFQMIQAYTRTIDWNDAKTIKKYILPLSPPADFGFHCFDVLESENKPFEERYTKILELAERYPLIKVVEQSEVQNSDDVKNTFGEALKDDYEGLILKNPKGLYKFGRGTINEGLIFKVKEFKTYDAKVILVTQATVAREGSEKTTNELGRSVTSKKKGDRVPIERAACFRVMYGDKELDVSLAMTHEEKDEVWKNKDNYIGKWIEYKAMEVGSKDVPRHAVMLRFREDKD